MSTTVLGLTVAKVAEEHNTTGIEVLVPVEDDEAERSRFTWKGETLNPGIYSVIRIHLDAEIDGRFPSLVLEVVPSGLTKPPLYLNIDNGNIRDQLAKQNWTIPE